MEAQPLGAAVQRVLAALDYLGQPLDAGSAAVVSAALGDANELSAITAIQNALDPHCLAAVNIDPDGRVKLRAGPAKPQLVEGGWTVFLVKVHNEAGVTAQLRARSPNAASTFDSPKDELRDRWMELALFETQPISKTLSGLAVEYRIVQLYSRDAGMREAKLLFDVGQGTQAAGFQNEVDIVFQCIPAQDVVLRVRDENDQPCAGAFEVRDEFGRVYPAQSKRAAPDFGFHPQVYRGDGDTLRLPPGRYAVKFTRGPEMLPILRTVDISPTVRQLEFKVERWVDPSLRGWFSGDHHIHAAGCAHYTKPSEGVHAPDMMLHCLGEDLKVGCNLTWGPCFDYQKQFFTGEDDAVSTCECILLSACLLMVSQLARVFAMLGTLWCVSAKTPTCCATTSRSRASAPISLATCVCCGSRSRSIQAEIRWTTGQPSASTHCAGPRAKEQSAGPPTLARVSLSRRPSCRTTSFHHLTASARTNTSWMSRTTFRPLVRTGALAQANWSVQSTSWRPSTPAMFGN